MKAEDIRINMKVYHDDVYWGREQMRVTQIRETEVELEGDWSGGTNNVCQRSWMPIKGLRLDYNNNPNYKI